MILCVVHMRIRTHKHQQNLGLLWDSAFAATSMIPINT